jgi:hypothetical protein
MRRLLALAVPMFLAAPAAGQSVFVSGGGYANIQQFGRYTTQSPTVFEENLSDTTQGFVFGVGGNLGRYVVVALELAFPGELHRAFEPARVLPPLPQPSIVTHRKVDYRSRHASVLMGYRVGPTHRVSAVLLGGAMFLQERTHTLSTTTPATPSNPLPFESTNVSYRIAPVVGIDVPIDLVKHFAVVPQARVYKVLNVSGPLGIWPGLSVRWTF